MSCDVVAYLLHKNGSTPWPRKPSTMVMKFSVFNLDLETATLDDLKEAISKQSSTHPDRIQGMLAEGEAKEIPVHMIRVLYKGREILSSSSSSSPSARDNNNANNKAQLLFKSKTAEDKITTRSSVNQLPRPTVKGESIEVQLALRGQSTSSTGGGEGRSGAGSMGKELLILGVLVVGVVCAVIGQNKGWW